MEEEIKKNIRKTGTTTLGIVCKDGIIVAADKRGSYGTHDGGVAYIASKDEEKVQAVTENIIVTTAGVASDLQKVIKVVRAELKLKELRTKKRPTIKESANLFSNIVYQNIRQFTTIPALTHFLLAGFDEAGAHLYEINADGYLQDISDYVSTGSGMMQVNPILDSSYKKDLTMEEAIKLATKSIITSMGRDPGTGEGLDIFAVTKNGIKQVVKQKISLELKN